MAYQEPTGSSAARAAARGPHMASGILKRRYVQTEIVSECGHIADRPPYGFRIVPEDTVASRQAGLERDEKRLAELEEQHRAHKAAQRRPPPSTQAEDLARSPFLSQHTEAFVEPGTEGSEITELSRFFYNLNVARGRR